MDLIILNEGTYHLVEVTKQMIATIKLYGTDSLDCFDLCEILRLKLTTYHEPWNSYFMNDGSGQFFGCKC